MIFPMWPEYYRVRAREALGSRAEIAAYFCAGVVCVLLTILFQWFICLVMGPVLIILAIFAWLDLRWKRENEFLNVRLNDASIDILDANSNVLRSTAYHDVRRAEVRTLKMHERIRQGRLELTRDCELIMIYIDGARCFDDLKLTKNGCCSGEELFFHPRCIALAYDEDAWNYLQLQID